MTITSSCAQMWKYTIQKENMKSFFFFWKMLTDTLRTMVTNPFKESFYEKKN